MGNGQWAKITKVITLRFSLSDYTSKGENKFNWRIGKFGRSGPLTLRRENIVAHKIDPREIMPTRPGVVSAELRRFAPGRWL